jgi:hypothetical protein
MHLIIPIKFISIFTKAYLCQLSPFSTCKSYSQCVLISSLYQRLGLPSTHFSCDFAINICMQFLFCLCVPHSHPSYKPYLHIFRETLYGCSRLKCSNCRQNILLRNNRWTLREDYRHIHVYTLLPSYHAVVSFPLSTRSKKWSERYRTAIKSLRCHSVYSAASNFAATLLLGADVASRITRVEGVATPVGYTRLRSAIVTMLYIARP